MKNGKQNQLNEETQSKSFKADDHLQQGMITLGMILGENFDFNNVISRCTL